MLLVKGFPISSKIIISRKTKQDAERTTVSSKFRLFRETINLRNSVPSHSAEGENERGAESEG